MRTSSGLEAVAFINALVHHPLVYPHFAAQTAAAESRMPAEVVRAVTALREISERKLRGAPSATIFKPLVAASMVLGEPIDSIEEVVRLLNQPVRLEEAMMRVQELTGPRNSYYSREGFRDFLDM
ncbi:hypothetical protein, partial [Salinispira pacifica]